MKYKLLQVACAALIGSSILMSGCAVVRNQETTAEYADDTATTTQIKAKMLEDKTVSAGAISVTTLKGVVQLSGFAKSQAEKARAEEIARGSRHVSAVKNDIIVKP